MYYGSILDLIGNTPLVKINKMNPNRENLLLAKLEFLNPGGSIKDRVGKSLLEDAENSGRLKKGGTVVEPTSGNTGTALAIAAAVKGYRTVFVMPDKMSSEKKTLLEAYGSQVVITPTAVPPEDGKSYYSVSDRLAEEIPGGHKPDQYKNRINPLTHYKTTGPEIWDQTEGKITHLVCGMGTGGTISGTGKFLKEKNPDIKIIGVDPEGSVYEEYFRTGRVPKIFKTYKMEGLGEDFIPETVDFSVIDDVLTVNDRQAFLTARSLARTEGILAGGSSGAALFAATEYSKKLNNAYMVVIFPDSGKSYLSKIFNDGWMKMHGFI